MTETEKSKIEPEFNRALNLWQNGNSQGAIKILKNLDKRFPNQPIILGMIGGIYFTLRDWANSIIYYEKTIKLSPKSELASTAFFLCLWNHEKFDEAIAEAGRFMKLNGFSEEYALIFEELDDNEIFQKLKI